MKFGFIEFHPCFEMEQTPMTLSADTVMEMFTSDPEREQYAYTIVNGDVEFMDMQELCDYVDCQPQGTMSKNTDTQTNEILADVFGIGEYVTVELEPHPDEDVNNFVVRDTATNKIVAKGGAPTRAAAKRWGEVMAKEYLINKN